MLRSLTSGADLECGFAKNCRTAVRAEKITEQTFRHKVKLWNKNSALDSLRALNQQQAFHSRSPHQTAL
jgi:hypothetical protein